MDRRLTRLIIPSLAALVALAILLGLGIWQLQRMSWKEGLIRQVTARMNTPPGPLPSREHWPILAKPEAEFTRLQLSGSYDFSKDVYFYHPRPEGRAGEPSGPGWDVISPMTLADGGVVLVNRGFVPDAKRLPAVRAALPAEASISGQVRLSEPRSWLAATDDKANRLFFTRDIAAFTEAMGLDRTMVAPFMINADAGPQTGLPQPGLHKLSLPNRHFEYALTWFGLAATLIGVFGVWLFGQLRRRALAQNTQIG